MKYLFFTLIILITFQGCKNNHLHNSTLHQNKQSGASQVISTLENNDTSNFNNEFEDEFDQDIDVKPDPFRVYNQAMTTFNGTIFLYGLNPVAKAYAYVVPEPLRIGVANVIHNIQYPVRLVNNLLQGKFQNASDETERFIVNTTLGLVGLFDPATTLKKLPKHNEDFGQTLGFYGVKSGFHVVLPFLGPSNLRDIAGITVDAYASPIVNVRGLENYKIPKNFAQSTAIVAGYYVNKTSLELGQYESLTEDAVELYPFLRDIYEQKRTAEIAE